MATRKSTTVSPKWIWMCFVAATILVAVPVYIFDLYSESYKDIKNSLFTGLLTCASFLLSGVSLLAFNVKKEFLASTDFEKQIALQAWHKVANKERKPQLDTSEIERVYSNFTSVIAMLVYCIVICIASSASQVTIGAIGSRLSNSICVGIAIAAILSLAYAVSYVYALLRTIIEYWKKLSIQSINKCYGDITAQYKTSAQIIAEAPAPGDIVNTEMKIDPVQ